VPFQHRHEDGSIGTALGDDLRPLLHAGFEHLAEASLRVLRLTLEDHGGR
jgi:hypothetical protein